MSLSDIIFGRYGSTPRLELPPQSPMWESTIRIAPAKYAALLERAERAERERNLALAAMKDLQQQLDAMKQAASQGEKL